MKVDSNPFFSRASELIDLDDKFVQLFSPEILNVFKNDNANIWGPVKIFRSSPGGGKTTLFKIFTSKLLSQIKERSNHDPHNRAIFEMLKELQAYNKNGNLTLAGSLIPFNNEYVSLEYLNINDVYRLRLFFSLLNTRIILSILQSISVAKDLKFPDDLSRIKINVDHALLVPKSIRTLSTGDQFYQWACDLEERICKEIDSINEINTEFLEGSDNLFSLDVFAPKNVTLDGSAAIDKVLVMLDDVHNLTANQRSHLIKSIIDKRPLVHTWISERLKALSIDEIFSEGSKENRDVSAIQLENFWASKHTAFEKFAKHVANRRIASVLDDQINFETFLSTSLDPESLKKVQEALPTVQQHIKENYGSNERYKNWISSKEEGTLVDDLEKLIAWRSLEILIHRDKIKGKTGQATLGLEVLEDDALEEQEGSDVRNAALLFLNREYGIPYYYGLPNICRLASYNIEQFLMVAGELFDEVIALSVKRIVKKNLKLFISPAKQEEILRKTITKKKYNDVLTITEIRTFLDSIGEFCKSETFVPNAWNSPGINGIAISMKERTLLKNIAINDPKHVYYRLAKCMATCFSNNLLDFKLNYKCKGKLLMVIYINKIYCVKYNLPLYYGKFKERNLTILLDWLNNGFKPQRPAQ